MEDIITALVPSLVDRGVFGPGHYMSLKSDESADGSHQYSTEVNMLKLRLKMHGHDTKTVPIVIKSQFSNLKCCKRRASSSMFQNEVTMYDCILPFLNPSEFEPYPKFYYGVATGGADFEKDVLIVGNLKYSGLALCRERLFFDYNHIAVAIRRLAELHSWSFIQKSRKESDFFRLVKKLGKFEHLRGDDDIDFDRMNYLTIKRGIDPLLISGNNKSILLDFLKISKNIQRVYAVLCEADEKFGVVVHGDYCKNNLLFKYDYKGQPTDCSYFDFQLSKYGSPAVDVSLFLYMHTSPEMRTSHWETLLRLYWDSVRENLPSDVRLPGYEDFEEHFSKRAVYGYLVSSFYLPNVLDRNVITNEEFIKLKTEDKLERFVNSAGEKGQMCISEIVNHMLHKEYIHKFMKHYANKTY